MRSPADVPSPTALTPRRTVLTSEAVRPILSLLAAQRR